MTRGTKYKWLLLLFIWGGCFLLSSGNGDAINSILDSREKKERFQNDMSFWEQNADKITGAIEQQRLMNHEIDSLKLGIAFLDATFNRIAADFSLTELKVDMDSRQAEGGSMPVKTSFRCTFKNGLDAIKKIQAKYVYIPFKSVKIDMKNTEKSVRFDILMDYKYHIKDM